MLDVLAKKVLEAGNKKSITRKDELADALEDMARDIQILTKPDRLVITDV